MDYGKLAADLLSGCDDVDCAFCEYSDFDIVCTINEKGSTAITELIARAEKAEMERDKIKSILRHYLSTNEENGVVYIPRHTVEKYAYGQKED